MTTVTDFFHYDTGRPGRMHVESGRIVALAEDLPLIGEVQSLQGATIAPALVDNHCHILPSGFDLGRLNLAPLLSAEAVLDAVRDRHRDEPDGWLIAVQYDQNRYGGIHLTRHDLDAISKARPIVLRHYNGHCSVANTAALRAAGVHDTSPDPAGGEFRRDANGAPDGVCFEHAHEMIWNAMPEPTHAERVAAILRAGASMADYGLVMAADMQTGQPDLLGELAAYRDSAATCAIETRLYLRWSKVFGPRAVDGDVLNAAIADLEATGRSRVCGIKIFADGAIGSATAAIYGAYVGETERETSGQLIYRPERLTEMVRTAADAGYPVAVHAIGDYAVDLVMDAFAATDDPTRHRLEHAMILRDAQIERLAALGCHVTMQPEFLHRFGHAYRRQLGDARTSRLKRFRSVLDAGIPLSFGSDRPIVPGDPRLAIRTAASRPDRFDPAENVSIREAIFAHTTAACAVTGERELGRLAPGFRAAWSDVSDLMG
ncbi:MAG: amidohydrolase [Fimbriimonadaceae bacterium]|nr:amidohydrolase [Fimbriimonadaceae bacterium]